MVSVLIITWKRPSLLEKCLHSLILWGNETSVQVHVLLNGEDAESSEFLTEFSAKHDWLTWREIEHSLPGKARNIGLQELKGEWIFLLDDDAQVPPDYLRNWTSIKNSLPNADIIGGTDCSPPDIFGLSLAVSLTLSSSLCMGPTAARHKAQEREPIKGDETILSSCNLWIKRSELINGLKFPENFRRAEETVYLKELKNKGAEIWHAPSLTVWHTRRHSWRSLAHTSFNSGYFRSKLMKENFKSKWWFWLPSVFVLFHLLIFISPVSAIPFVGWWLFPVAAQSWLICVKNRQHKLWPQIVTLHWLIPFTYGIGFLCNRFKGRPWQK